MVLLDPPTAGRRHALVRDARDPAKAPGPRLESFDWRDRSLELSLNAPNTDSIARFAQGVNERGLAADVTSTTNNEKGLQARVRVAAGGAP